MPADTTVFNSDFFVKRLVELAIQMAPNATAEQKEMMRKLQQSAVEANEYTARINQNKIEHLENENRLWVDAILKQQQINSHMMELARQTTETYQYISNQAVQNVRDISIENDLLKLEMELLSKKL